MAGEKSGVLAKTGPVSYTVETSDHIVWRRHTDQLLHSSGSSDDPKTPASSVPDLGVYPSKGGGICYVLTL